VSCRWTDAIGSSKSTRLRDAAGALRPRCPTGATGLRRGATARTGSDPALVSNVMRADTRGLLGTPAPVSRSGFVKSHVANGAVNGDSTRTTSHEAQSFENMSWNAGEQEQRQADSRGNR